MACRHAVGDRWYVDEAHVKVAGRYVNRPGHRYGQIIDVDVSASSDTQTARRFLMTALRSHGQPAQVVEDRAQTRLAVVDEPVPAAFPQHGPAREQADRADRLKAPPRPMRGLKRDPSARVVMWGHALMQNLWRGHYELGCDTRSHRRVAAVFTEVARVIWTGSNPRLGLARHLRLNATEPAQVVGSWWAEGRE